MNMRFCAGSIDALGNRMFPQYRKVESGKVMIGLRGWTEENMPDWRIPVEYYKNALVELPGGVQGHREFLVLTDDAEYAQSVIGELGMSGAKVEVVVGNRSWESIAAQFDKAMQCDHFVLVNSTFHIWPALFATGGRDKMIAYPKVDAMTSLELELYPGARFVCLPVPGYTIA